MGSLGEEHLSFVDYKKLGTNPIAYGEDMSEEAAVEILGKLLPRMQVKAMAKEIEEKIRANRTILASLNNKYIAQESLWKAFDAYIDKFQLMDKFKGGKK